MMMVLIPASRVYYPLTHEQWALLQLFDGERSYSEIAELYAAQSNSLFTEQDVAAFVDALAGGEFWYKTPQEKNVTLWEKLEEQRRKRTKPKSKYGDLAEITFSAWDPDKYLTKLHAKVGFVFSRTFVLINAALFAWMAYIWISHWGEIGHDSL